jgi:hypothetical protein
MAEMAQVSRVGEVMVVRMPDRAACAVAIAVLRASGACQRSPVPEDVSLPQGGIPRPVVTPAGDGAADPWLFADSDGALLLSWLEPTPAGHALRIARRAGEGWGPVETVVERDDLFVTGLPSLGHTFA